MLQKQLKSKDLGMAPVFYYVATWSSSPVTCRHAASDSPLFYAGTESLNGSGYTPPLIIHREWKYWHRTFFSNTRTSNYFSDLLFLSNLSVCIDNTWDFWISYHNHACLLLFFFICLFVVDFVIHWNETAMDLHVFPIPLPPPTSLSTRSLWVFPVHQVRALVSCIQPGLVISFTLDNIHVSMLFSCNIPPSPSPTESKRLFYTSVSLFLFCIWVIINIFLNSTYMC